MSFHCRCNRVSEYFLGGSVLSTYALVDLVPDVVRAGVEGTVKELAMHTLVAAS
jgi:hypothetical protein